MIKVTKDRKLRDIEVREVSFVDKPANKTQFLIVKNDGHKGQGVMDKKFVALLKDYFDVKELTFDEEISKADSDTNVAAITGAVDTLKKYKGDLPDALDTAMDTVVKHAVMSLLVEKTEDDKEDLEKAGKKHSKATTTELLEIRSKITSLLDPEDVEKSDKEIELTPSEKLLMAKIGSLEEQIKASKEETKKSDDDKEDDDDEDKKITALEKRLEDLENSGANKTSLSKEEQDVKDNEDKKKTKSEFKSIADSLDFGS